MESFTDGGGVTIVSCPCRLERLHVVVRLAWLCACMLPSALQSCKLGGQRHLPAKRTWLISYSEHACLEPSHL